MSKELEKAGLPVALISAMFPVAQQVRANRIVKGGEHPASVRRSEFVQRTRRAPTPRNYSDRAQSSRSRGQRTDGILSARGHGRVTTPAAARLPSLRSPQMR